MPFPPCKRLLLALVMIALLCRTASFAGATVMFLGIGNDEFAGDVTVSSNTIRPFLRQPGDSVSTVMNQNGAGILAQLNAAKAGKMAGDLFIFHYAGHGDAPGIADAVPIDENNVGNNGDEGVIGLQADFPNGARDDEIASIINMFPASVGILTIFDNCFAGEMIDGTADIARGLIVGTTDADHCADGTSLFLPFWIDAFSSNNLGSIKADGNNDGILTLGELFGHLDNIDGVINSFGGRAFATNFETPDHLNYVVGTVVPEPSTLVLVGAGVLSMIILGGRRRKQTA